MGLIALVGIFKWVGAETPNSYMSVRPYSEVQGLSIFVPVQVGNESVLFFSPKPQGIIRGR